MDKIKEVMGLVDAYVNGCVLASQYGFDSTDADLVLERESIESKLRELLELEPLEKDAARWPVGYSGAIMFGNRVSLHFDTQENAYEWLDDFLRKDESAMKG